MKVTINDELVRKWIETAKGVTCIEQSEADGDEYFDPSSASGGNFDDAYAIGHGDAEIEAKRECLEALGIKYEAEKKPLGIEMADKIDEMLGT